MRNLVLLPILLLSFLSCTKHPKDNIIRPLRTTSGDFTAKATKSVQLSTINEVLIDDIYMIEYYLDRIYVFDQGEKCLLIFTSEGNLIKKLIRGKGPGELMDPMGISCYQNRLIITDRNLIKYYSLEGEFVQYKKLPRGCFATCVTSLPNGNFLTYGMSPDFSKELKADYRSNQFYYYHILDSTLTKEILPIVTLSMECGGMERGKPFHFYKNHYLLAEGIGNHLLIFNGENVVDTYTIDFEGFTFNDEDLKKTKYAYLDLINAGSRYGFIDKVNETKDLITFRYWRKGTEQPILKPTILYSKRSAKTADFSEVLKSVGIPEVELMNTRDDDFICLLQPSDFTEEQLNQFKKQGLINTSVTPDSNPVVIFITVKER
ncbi:MAG: 6-bladed beta-propeller [Bacteroidales bacterium]|jgi:hypothetical protein